MEDGTARAGTATTIQLAADESAVEDAYKGLRIALLAGPGAGDHRGVAAYAGATRIASVDSAFSATPTTATTYRLFKAIKFAALNLGPRALNAELRIEQKDSSDGNTMALIAIDADTISPPCNVVGAPIAGGGSFAAIGTYYYRITATNALGETVGSIEVAVTISAVTQTIVLS